MSSHVGALAAPGGYTDITPNAFNQVGKAAASEVLGVRTRDVSVETNERQGRLDMRVDVKLPVPSLTRVLEDPGVLEASGGPLCQRVESAREKLRERTAALTGSLMGRVDIIVSSVSVQKTHGRGLR